MPHWNVDKIQYFTQSELKRFFSVITSQRDRALFLLAYRHGLRASEMGLLRVSDIDFARHRLRIHRLKNSISGTHTLQPDEVKFLKAHLRSVNETDILFPTN